MYQGKKISLVLPAFNEAKNIDHAIKEFKILGCFDEIVVVDNNSTDETAAISQKNGARVVKEQRQGYGFALRQGLSQARGDYVVLSEPDGTFVANDVFKLLAPLKDFEMVTGTRTNQKFIAPGANMGFFLRMGNILVAKIIQFLFRTNSLSDCGCTFRALRQSLVKKILPHLKVGGSHFLPETVILTAFSGGTIFEVPVHYQKRVGTSKITGSLRRSFLVALRMLGLICRYRLVTKPIFK